MDMNLPSDDDRAVKDPPLSALTGARKVGEKRGDGGRETGRLEEDRRRGPPPGAGRRGGRPGHAPWAGPPPPGYAYAGPPFS